VPFGPCGKLVEHRGAHVKLGGSMYAAGGPDRKQLVEKYNMDSDSWSDVSLMLGGGRTEFCALSMTARVEIVEENLFDNLIAKVEARRRG